MVSPSPGEGGPEQLELVPPPASPRRRRTGPRSDVPVAQTDPVARVVVDTPLAHLDRPFEYAVPEELADDAVPGARVRIRLAGRDRDAFVLERTAEAEHDGRLTPLRSVVSREPVLTPQVARLARSVADHYGGTLSDTLRLAVPPRHARAERSVPPAGGASSDDRSGAEAEPDTAAAAAAARSGPAWEQYPAGAAFLRRVREGGAPAASWLALPGRLGDEDWPAAIAEAVAATLAGGRGAVVVVPDHRDVDRLLSVLTATVGEEQVVRLTADLGPEARYRAFLQVLRGHARVVVGTRGSAFAPVRDLGLVVCWDEGDDLHQEPRAPYPHVREVLARRAALEGAALLLGGFTRSVAVQAWVAQGRVAPVGASSAAVRASAPAVVVAGEGHQEARDAAARSARIPSIAWRTLRSGLQDGPVLVQVPRQGYVVGLACQDCRTATRCARCHGPVAAPDGAAAPVCRWCATPVAAGAECRECGSTRRRATAVGERRTAEELGRAFPGVRVISSGGEHVVAEVGPDPALVVATPGAEPWCPSGYRAVALLDGWRLLERASLDAQPEALRRWCAAAALVVGAPPAPGARRLPAVVLCGVPQHATILAVEALVRWDPAWLAAREVEERVELGLPPARRHALVRGPADAVADATRGLLAAGHEVLGDPVPAGASPGTRSDPRARGLPSRANSTEGPAPVVAVTVREVAVERPAAPLASAVQSVRAERSGRKAPGTLRIAMDGADVLG